jgi:septal ring factor EnvC (AmiA/AmiB activator)
MALSGCPAFYAGSPRFGRSRSGPARQGRARPRHPLEARKASLPWPVSGTLVGRYGLQLSPKYGTKTKSQGIDIACRPGSPVTAIGSGGVSYADRFRGYGLMVILEHGGGFHSIYAGLSGLEVTMGERVREHETLGFAADTIHFEIRVGGKSVDPLFWLAPR